MVLETHAHADHLSAAPYFKAKTGALIGIGEHIRDVQKIFRPIFSQGDLRTDGSDFDRWETTVGEQRHTNGHVHDGVGEEEFVAMREARDATLTAPKLLQPSIQVNIRAGGFPEAEANGVRYLKIYP